MLEEEKNTNDLEKSLLYCHDDDCTTNTEISINATSILNQPLCCRYLYLFFGIVIIVFFCWEFFFYFS
jgi:hypothetical protein